MIDKKAVDLIYGFLFEIYFLFDKIMDYNYKIKTINEAKDGYWVTTDYSSCYLSKEYGVEPKVDDVFKTHMAGSKIRGVDINGSSVFYKTDEELQQERLNKLKEIWERKKATFLEEKDGLDASFNSLPKAFQESIQKKRDADPNYRINNEAIEMFCYKEAVEIANNLPKFKGIPNYDLKARVEKFQSLSFNEQKKLVPSLSDGHSGGTLGTACALASDYVSSSEFAAKKIQNVKNDMNNDNSFISKVKRFFN